MPVVSKRKIYVDAVLKDVMMEINYSSKTCKFSADLPAQVIDKLMLKDKCVTADTEGKAATLFEEKIREYNEAKKQVSTVLLFRIKLNGVIPPDDNPRMHVADHNADLFKMYKKDISGWSGLHPLGMILEWGVYEKTFYKEQKKYSRIAWFEHHDKETRIRGNGINDLRDSSTEKDGIKELPYSEDREKWFANLQLSFEALLLKVNEKLASLDSASLLKLVDSNTFKLLTA